MIEFKKVANIWKKVFSNKRYLLLLPIIAILFYILDISISNFWIITNFYKTYNFPRALVLTFDLILNFKKTILFSSFLSLVIISILTSIILILMIYNFKFIKKPIAKKTGFFASIGIFLGVFAPGCVACGLGLAGLFGLATSFAILPFKGKEISLIAIFILSFSILKTTFELEKPNECCINNKLKGG